MSKDVLVKLVPHTQPFVFQAARQIFKTIPEFTGMNPARWISVAQGEDAAKEICPLPVAAAIWNQQRRRAG